MMAECDRERPRTIARDRDRERNLRLAVGEEKESHLRVLDRHK